MTSPISKRSPAQTEKRAAVEAAVLTATEELLAEGNAYSDLKIEAIATRAGIGRTAFYFYFRDKRELLMRLTADVANLFYAEAEGWFAQDADGPGELAGSLQRIAAHYREHGPVLRAIVEASTYDEPVAQFWRALMGRFVEASRGRIEREHTDTTAKTAGAMAFALVWMTERTLYEELVQEGAGLDRESVERGMITVWLRSIYGVDSVPGAG